jgi:hypothetical protein
MGLLDGLEKIINEHGSAVILKERIALANDQYAILEKKFEASALRVAELESENKALRLNLEKEKAEVENLKGITEKSRNARLDAVKEKILVLLAGQETYERNIAQTLGVGNQVAAFHLQELEGAAFIGRSLSMTGEEFPWYLEQEGRRYLVSHGLIA